MILLLPFLLASSHCAGPAPAPTANPSTDSATMGPDEGAETAGPHPPVTAPDPATALPDPTDTSENTMAEIDDVIVGAPRPSSGGGAVRVPITAAGPPAASRDEPVSCDAIDDDVSAADCAEFTRQKARLRPGMLAFDPPAKMTVGVTYDLTLSIGKAADAEDVRADVRREGRRIEERSLQVGAFMTANLTGTAFTIKLQGDQPAERKLGADRREIWQWQVTPSRAGQQRLLLKVSADAVAADGRRHRFALANRPVDVLVEVSAAQRREDRTKGIEDSLGRGARVMSALEKWLIGLAALLAAAGGAWLALRKFGRGKEASDEPGKPQP
ncbi:hypothetical protein BXU08_04315 [Sphingomonas sp. LM7]|nr:hypothetical protein BXU08_04315 [Sphingomonas sp. LM7]